MTFAEHLDNHRASDGSYDLGAAEDARADEIAAELAADPEKVEALARKAAQRERSQWESSETATLRKQFMQPALSSELDLEVKVPLGDSTAVEYGDMNATRIRLRKDLRTKVHIEEARAYDTERLLDIGKTVREMFPDTEWTHWTNTERLLDIGKTVREMFPDPTA